MMPTNPNVKHPAILDAIERTHARQKRRMERTPGRAKPINEIPVGGLLIDRHDEFKPVEDKFYYQQKVIKRDEQIERLLDKMNEIEAENAKLKHDNAWLILWFIVTAVAVVVWAVGVWL